MGTLLGKKIGPYKVNKLLGRGGMGEVYLATDENLDRYAALKVLKPELSSDANFISRFSQEAKTMAKFNHQHIATLYTILKEGNQYIMAMEYIDGIPFDEFLKEKGPMPAQELLPIIISVLDGLSHAHEKNIVHRDLKPSNLMFNKSGLMKVMDFGIARGQKDDRHTKTGMIIGTLEYMAPELIKGEEASYASDLYAIGIILYEALSGQFPFERGSEYTLMQAHVQKKPVPIQQYKADIPKSLSKYIARLLAKEPQKRFSSTQQALEELKKIEKSLQVAGVAKVKSSAGSSLAVGSHPIIVKLKNNWQLIAFGLSLLLLVGIGVSRISSSPAEPHTIDNDDELPTAGSAALSDINFTPPISPQQATPSTTETNVQVIQKLLAKGETLAKEKKYLGAYPSLFLVSKQILELDSDQAQAKNWLSIIADHFYQEGLQAFTNKDKNAIEKSILVLEKIASNDTRISKLKAKLKQLQIRKPKSKTSIAKNETPVSPQKNTRPNRPNEQTTIVNHSDNRPVQNEKSNENNKSSSTSELASKDNPSSVTQPEDQSEGGQRSTQPTAASRTAQLATGEAILLKIDQALSTDMNLQPGQSLAFSVAQSIDGMSAGVRVDASVSRFKPTAKGKKAMLELNIKSITGPDGQNLSVKRGLIYLTANKKGEPITIKKGSTFKVYSSQSITFKY